MGGHPPFQEAQSLQIVGKWEYLGQDREHWHLAGTLGRNPSTCHLPHLTAPTWLLLPTSNFPCFSFPICKMEKAPSDSTKFLKLVLRIAPAPMPLWVACQPPSQPLTVFGTWSPGYQEGFPGVPLLGLGVSEEFSVDAPLGPTGLRGVGSRFLPQTPTPPR